MNIHLYRPVATQAVEYYDESYGETILIEPGDNLGHRRGGYLSRSSAVAQGKASGHPFRIERSNPVTFGGQSNSRRDELERMARTLADLVVSGDQATAQALAAVIRSR